MLQLLTATIVSALAGVGWIISRWARKDALSERIERRLKLVALHQRMKGARLSVQDLAKMEQELSSETVADRAGFASKLSNRHPENCSPNDAAAAPTLGVAERPDPTSVEITPRLGFKDYSIQIRSGQGLCSVEEG